VSSVKILVHEPRTVRVLPCNRGRSTCKTAFKHHVQSKLLPQRHLAADTKKQCWRKHDNRHFYHFCTRRAIDYWLKFIEISTRTWNRPVEREDNEPCVCLIKCTDDRLTDAFWPKPNWPRRPTRYSIREPHMTLLSVAPQFSPDWKVPASMSS
jgi:hypothetical protein